MAVSEFLVRIEKRRHPRLWVSPPNHNYLFSKGYVSRPENMRDIPRVARRIARIRWAMYGYKWAMAKMLSDVEGLPYYLVYATTLPGIDKKLYGIAVRKPFTLLLVDKETYSVLEEHPPTEDIKKLISESSE